MTPKCAKPLVPPPESTRITPASPENGLRASIHAAKNAHNTFFMNISPSLIEKRLRPIPDQNRYSFLLSIDKDNYYRLVNLERQHKIKPSRRLKFERKREAPHAVFFLRYVLDVFPDDELRRGYVNCS